MRAMRRDRNESEIVLALQKCGATVARIYGAGVAGVPDLVAGVDGRNFLIECKMPLTGRLSEAQKQWRDEWRGSKPFVLKSPDDVVRFIQLVKGGPSREKETQSQVQIL